MTQTFRKKHLLRDSGGRKQERVELLKRLKRELKGEAVSLLGEGGEQEINTLPLQSAGSGRLI